MAHKFSLETERYEEQAKNLSQTLQIVTSKAQITRNKMLRVKLFKFYKSVKANLGWELSQTIGNESYLDHD